MQPPQITRIQIPGSNYQVGRAAKIDQITFHHIVGDAPAAIARFKDGSQIASSTYVIGSDGRIYQLVDEKDTPYTDANFSSNSRAITIEHAGGHASVPYTEAMYKSSAKLVAWIRSRHNITRFMRHRDVSSKPTACPGSLDVERIVRESNNTQGAIPMVNDADNEYWRWNKLFLQIRGRNATREEFRAHAVGKNWLTAMEILSDDPEADRALQAQNVGAVAVRDNWEKQITDLQKALQDCHAAGSGGIDQGTKDDIGFIKATVQWIKDKLSSVFK